MAPKRPAPIQDPDSSSEEEEESEEEEQPQQQPHKKAVASTSITPTAPAAAAANKKPDSQAQASSDDDSGSGSGSESDSDSDSPPPIVAEPSAKKARSVAEPSAKKARSVAEPSVKKGRSVAEPSVKKARSVAEPSVKPVSSKPKNDLANVEKPRSKPATPVKASGKRSVQDSEAEVKVSKREKAKGVTVEGDGSKPATPVKAPIKASGKRPVQDSEAETKVSKREKAKGVAVEGDGSKPASPVKAPIKASGKRPVQDSEAEAKVSKLEKAKGVAVEGDGSKPPGSDSKKALFERIFQPEDEVALLRGMLDYSAKTGADPFTDLEGFYVYVKKSVNVSFNKTQLLNKLKRLKKKYMNIDRRRGKNGAERRFSKAVDQESYNLSKNIWGGEASNLGGGVNVVVPAKSDGKAKKARQVPEAEKAKELEKRDAKLKSGPSCDFIFIKKCLVSSCLDENLLNHGLSLMDSAKKSEMEEKWRMLLIDELELFRRRVSLVRAQTELVVDAHKKSNSTS